MRKKMLLLAIYFLFFKTILFAQGFVGINTTTPTARLSINNPATTDAFLINHTATGRITKIDSNRLFYHEGTFWVHSGEGSLRYGFPTRGWLFETFLGGKDLQLFSHSSGDIPASRIQRIYFDGTNGNMGIGTFIPAIPYAKLTVKGNSTSGSEKALAVLNSADEVLLTIGNDGNVGIGTNSPTEKLELNNGFIKVSGTNKTAFKHTSTVGNISSNWSDITYDSPSVDDIVLVTHNYSPTSTYFDKNFGVFWHASSSKWAVYIEDLSAMPVNITFNVLVIKQ